jgi:hypothetical protein
MLIKEYISYIPSYISAIFIKILHRKDICDSLFVHITRLISCFSILYSILYPISIFRTSLARIEQKPTSEASKYQETAIRRRDKYIII